jgi:hypothetical protein
MVNREQLKSKESETYGKIVNDATEADRLFREMVELLVDARPRTQVPKMCGR